MKQFIKNLGKVSITVEGVWDRNKEYERLSIVYREDNNTSYISKIEVPSNIDTENIEYWSPIVKNMIDGNLSDIENEIINNTIKLYPLIINYDGVKNPYEKDINNNITIKLTAKHKDINVPKGQIEYTDLDNELTFTDDTYTITTAISKTINILGSYYFDILGKKQLITSNIIINIICVNPCWFGFSKYNTMSEIDMNETGGFTKYIKTSPNGTYTIIGNEEGYIWLCVPNTMTINKVTMSGFEVPVEELNIGGVSGYRNYRSSNKLKAGSYTILIS